MLGRKNLGQCYIFSFREQTSGACVASSDYYLDLCGGGTGGDPLGSYWNPDTGASANCTIDSSPASEWIWLYLSTASTDLVIDETCADCDWNPPSSDNLTKGITLGAALIISAAKTSTFKTNLTNRIADYTQLGSVECALLKPAFTFEQQKEKYEIFNIHDCYCILTVSHCLLLCKER